MLQFRSIKESFAEIRTLLAPILRVTLHNNQDSLLNNEFLHHTFSADIRTANRTVWTLMKLVRLMAIVGVALRFVLNADEYGSPQWGLLVYCAIAFFAVIELRAWFCGYDRFNNSDKLRSEVRWQTCLEVIAITLLYALTKRSDSDLYLLMVIPLISVIQFLYSRDIFIVLFAIILLTCCAAYIAGYFDPTGNKGFLDIITHVCIIRAVFLIVCAFFCLYLFRSISIQHAIWAALMEAIPEGLAIIGKPDHQIKWVNNVMQNQYFPDRELVGVRCHYAYRRSQEKCDPCLADDAFKGIKGESITTSPEYIRPDEVESIPPIETWRRYATLSTPLWYEGCIIAALECVKDVTSREVLYEATRKLQAASNEDEVLQIAAKSISALGYKRVRVYLLTPDEQYFIAKIGIGMNATFINWKLPKQGEAYSETTCNSYEPQVYTAPKEDLYRKDLQKDHDMPWIEIPLKLDNDLYGKISIDNKAHPIEQRRMLKAELKSKNIGDPSDILTALFSLGVQTSLAIKQIRTQTDMAELLRQFVHHNQSLLNIITSNAQQIYTETQITQEDKDQAYTDMQSVIHNLRLESRKVLNWGDLIRNQSIVRKVQADKIDIVEVVHNIVRWCSFRARDINCKVSVVPHEPLIAMVDKSKLEQILFILLNNSFDAVYRVSTRQRARKVDISINRMQDTIEIVITDSGNGVPDELAEAIFLPRMSFDPYRGLGLGLYIARQLATVHGGSVALIKRDHFVGTTFCMRLKEDLANWR